MVNAIRSENVEIPGGTLEQGKWEVGLRTMGPAVEDVLRAIAEAVPGDRYAEWLATLGQWYRPDARFGEAFCRLMARLLGPRCPLLLPAHRYRHTGRNLRHRG